MDKITQTEFEDQAHKCVGFLNATQSPGEDGKLDRDEVDRGVMLGAQALEALLRLPLKSITTETLIDDDKNFAGGRWTYSGDRAEEPLTYEYELAFGEVGVDVIDNVSKRDTVA